MQFRFVQSTTHAVRHSALLGRLNDLVRRIGDAGTSGYLPDVRRRLKILNLVAYLIAFTTLIYLFQQLSMDYAKYRPVIWLNAALIPIALAVPLANRINEVAGGLLLLTVEYVAQFLFIAHLGNHSGMQMHYFVAAAAPFVVFGLERIRLIAACVVGALGLHLFAWFRFPVHQAIIPADQAVLDSLYVQAAITTMGLLAATVWYAFSLAEQARAETDRLLRRILPAAVVDRVKAEPGALIADSFDEVAVLFADISGFVALSRRLGAKATVGMLNEIVNEFDCLAAKHGVEKIKTIGDAYMAAAGVPVPVADPCARMVRMAIDMQSELAKLRQKTGLPLNMRIGIASGPVTAGVIGSVKFSYDVWGDTVNLAARLEQAGAVDRIQLCETTHARVMAEFACEPHGTIDIKGVGPRRTWFVLQTASATGI